MAVIEIENLSFTYTGKTEKALDNINLKIGNGEFVVLCGESGCGKTTLLRLLKRSLAPVGEKSGRVLYNGVEISELDERKSVTDIGFVAQNPENGIVTDKVYHELAFGLENLGVDSDEIRRRVAEVCGFFGIGEWYRRDAFSLSGGQKQLLSLASVMVMRPEVLILDEPTAQLDPIAASDFIATLKKINEELGTTVILSEHRLEEVLPLADKAVIMNRAEILTCCTPREAGAKLRELAPEHKMNYSLPSAVKIFSALGGDGECPLTVREGKNFLENNYGNVYGGYDVEKEDYSAREKAIEISGGFFRYERETPDVLSGLDITVYEKEILCILGGNGAGKTTLLKIMSGVKRLYRGKMRVWEKKIKEYGGNSLYLNNIAAVPQDPRTLFVKNSLRADLLQTACLMGSDKAQAEKKVGEIAEKLSVSHLLDMHPFDLSGGEIQKAAFAKLLLTSPRIILLDEPTKGIDGYSKKVFAEMLYELKAQGVTVVIVTHDAEFAAEYSDRCAMFFDGQIVSADNPVNFFSTNSYYTTAASRISRGLYRNAVTADMVVELARKNGTRKGSGANG